MDALKILVNSSRKAFGEALEHELPSACFDIVTAEPGPSFLEAVGRMHPDIAVVDFVDGRGDTAELEIDLLRAIQPDVRIVPVGLGAIVSPADVLRRIREEEASRFATCA